MREKDIALKIAEMEDRMIIELNRILKGDNNKIQLFTHKHQMAIQAMFTILQQDLGTEETHQIIEMYLKFNKEIETFANKLFTH